MKNFLKILAFTFAFASTTASAASSVMTFDGTSGLPSSYSEAGFTVLSLAGHLHFNNDNTLNTHNGGCCSDPYQFTAQNGSAFSFSSFDLTASSGDMSFTADNGSVYSIAAGTIGHFDLSGMGFDGINSVVWHVADNLGYGEGNIDNVTFNASAVPEPASISLLGLGIVGVLAARRRNRAK